MPQIVLDILDQAEVWSTLIALIIFGFNRKQPAFLQPVIIYLFIALIFYAVGNSLVNYKHLYPAWMPYNNVLYNIHSLVRFTCFTIFFSKLNLPYYKTLRKVLPFLSLLFIIINFGFRENFFYDQRINSKLLTVEAYLLLINCMLYYLSQLREEVEDMRKRKDFWVTTGLCSYVVINFFVFLFYDPAFDQGSSIAEKLWNIHNVAQIIFCLLIAKAFYVSPKNI